MALRKGDWKLVKAPGLAAGAEALTGKANSAGAELYNLTEDVSEKNNVAGQQPAKVRELAQAWEAWNAELVEPAWGGAPQRPGAVRRAETRLISNAPTNGPWKRGDTLNGADAPQVANRPFSLSAEIEATSPNGVIIAQGGAAHGYTLFLEEGKLAFGIRVARNLSTVRAKDLLGKGPHHVEARLAADGMFTLVVDGQIVATGRAAGLIPAQPVRGLAVGSDHGPVGPYASPNAFDGNIEQVQIHFP